MILRYSPASSSNPDPRPAYEVFLAHQKAVRAPFLAVPQSTHAHLAGELAERLLPDFFGPLAPEALQATRQHDYGWIGSDLHQLESVDYALVRDFPALTPDEAMPAWHASVRLGETVSPLVGVLVNRHFCLLARDAGGAEHENFAAEAAARRLPVERTLSAQAAELDRWTAALGFCDLLSLYLCSGSRDAMEIPLCHPADGEAREHVGKVSFHWEGDLLHSSPAAFAPGTRVSQSVPALGPHTEPTLLSWQFVQ